MAKDQTFKKFVEAQAKYRKGVVGMTFEPYGKVVTAKIEDPKALVEALKKVQSPQQVAVHQQALDMMSASRRAQDMRKMGHQDFIANYAAASSFQDNYGKSRLDRFEAGLF